MVVHVVDMGEPSPEDFSISRSVASLEEVRLNRDAFPDAESETYSDFAFSVQL
jgi:hypothetical protein